MTPMYRCFHKNEKIMYPVELLYLGDNPYIWVTRDDVMNSRSQYPLADVILMQYTTMRDTQHAPIFEGDIIRQHDVEFKVQWDVRGAWYAERMDLEHNHYRLNQFALDCEIVGNIHEPRKSTTLVE